MCLRLSSVIDISSCCISFPYFNVKYFVFLRSKEIKSLLCDGQQDAGIIYHYSGHAFLAMHYHLVFKSKLNAISIVHFFLRSKVSEFLLSGGQQSRWLLGSKIITITTSGGANMGKAGLCEKCLRQARNITADRQQQQATDKYVNILMEYSHDVLVM